jgi:hypothetical protein
VVRLVQVLEAVVVVVRADAMVQLVEVSVYRAHAVARSLLQQGELEAFRAEVVVPAVAIFQMEQALTAQSELFGPVAHDLTHQLTPDRHKVLGAINEFTY